MISSVRIVIGGDVCPIGRNSQLFENGNAEGIFNDLLDEFVAADLAVVNLECPLIERATPILKSGPVLDAKDECVNGLKNANIHVVGLANNHILDHGEQGLTNTVRVCREAGMEVVGAGKNLADAGKTLRLHVKDVRIGIMAVAEHEFSIAAKDKPGANPLSMMEFIRQMRHHRQKYDYVIVLLHGGTEYYPYPSPELQRRCRFMIEEGANAVICQHSHCPGCYEYYEGGHIVYGQGNLIFDGHPRRQGEWNQGFLVRLSIKDVRTAQMDLIPFIQSNEQAGARRMSMDEEAVFMQDLKVKSEQIREKDFVERNWLAFCSKKKHFYFSILRGHSGRFRKLNRITHFTDHLYSRNRLMQLLNVVRCEAHREVLQTILSEL